MRRLTACAVTVAILVVVLLEVLPLGSIASAVSQPGYRGSPGTGGFLHPLELSSSGGGEPSGSSILSSSSLKATGPLNPANCSQGTNTVQLSPSSGSMHDALFNAYTTLGREGGGTVELGPGVYYVNETLNFYNYDNVSFQGAGMGKTILSLPPDPVGRFTADNGTPVGLYNYTTGRSTNGTMANFLEVIGSPIDNFEMCNLALDAQANNASEAWAGSLLVDESGGFHHVYSDIAEIGFFGPGAAPNGMHIQPPTPWAVTSGYVIDNLEASNNSLPYETYPGVRGGPAFLDVGNIANCVLENISGIGLAEFELSPPQGCVVENWNIHGHVLIDPRVGGSWGGTIFMNVTVNESGTAAPNALAISVANGSGGMGSNFTALSWVDDTFNGAVLGGANLVSVYGSMFDGGINSTPAYFVDNKVVYTDPSPDPVNLPIRIEGSTNGGNSATVTGDTFLLPNGSADKDPFLITVPQVTLVSDAVMISGQSTGYLLSGPGVTISENSTISGWTYESLGNSSPSSLVLLDLVGSPGFVDAGAIVGNLTGIYSNLPQFVPWAPNDLWLTGRTATTVSLEWNSSTGPVTNYSVLVGGSASSYSLYLSAGPRPGYTVEGLQAATQYYFAVEAWNGSRHSAPSVALSALTRPLSAYEPSVPTGLTVLDRGYTFIDVRWNSSVGAVTNYTVYQGTNNSWLNPVGSSGTTTQFNATGLSSGTEYYFAVEAWNGSWTAGQGPTVNASTLRPIVPIVSHSASIPLSLSNWLEILAIGAGVFAGVFGPLALVGHLRAAKRSRRESRPNRPDGGPAARRRSSNTGEILRT
jgi:hypothetical protein